MEEYVHQIPELVCLAADKENASVLDVSGTDREKAAVKAHSSLHIPHATLLRLRRGNRVNGIVRQYALCAGFRLSNDYPNNIGLFQTGRGPSDFEVVYIERFERQEPNDLVVPLGRRFNLVRGLFVCFPVYHLHMNVSGARATNNLSPSYPQRLPYR